jgi:hypothetical protein
MTELPKWIVEMEKCDACGDIGLLTSTDLANNRVEAYYECKCGYKFGFAHTGKRVDSFKKYLEAKKD